MHYLKKYDWKLGVWTKVLVWLLVFGLSHGPTIVYAQEWTEILSVEGDKKAMPPSVEDKLKQIVSFEYNNADLSNVLRSLAWTYDLNIVTSADVKGKVTINLKDVTVKEALDAILTINGLAYSERAGIMYVAPGDPKAIDMQTEVIFLKYLSSSEAQNLLSKIMSAKGDMQINEVVNSLIVTDFPANIKKIQLLLEKVDIPPQQVLIEAKIVDITSNALEALGVTYDVDYQPGEGLIDRDTAYAERVKGTISMAEQSSSLSGGQFTLNTLSFKGLTITATLDALVKDGKANLLASPSIAVLNGREARIIIGERYPYKERTQTTSGTTETVRFVDIGTTLRVIPQINRDGYITMNVHPEVSSLAASLDAGPRITTREADTTVRVKEGHTLVIGGLIKQTDDRSKEKIPILGSLPIIGFLFSRSESSIQQKELAVFITPRIVRSIEEKKALSQKEIESEEAYVTLEKTAELSLVENLFQSAAALDRGIGIESIRKDIRFRKTQALSLYEHIIAQFPGSKHKPEAMYRAGNIYYEYLKDYKNAKEVFSRLISDHPDTRFARKAKFKYRKSERLTSSSKKKRR